MRPSHQVQDAAVERALGSRASRQILSTCIRKPLSVRDISDQSGLPLASTYRNVKGLIDEGLLVVERSAMTADGKPYDLYRSRVKEASLRVAPDRVETIWAPNTGLDDRLITMWDRLGAA